MTTATRLPPVLLLAVVLHTAVLPQMRILDVGADLMLLVAVAAGLTAGPDRGAAVGFASGLLADCFLQTPFGLSALAYSLVGFGVGRFQTTILHARWWISPVTVVVASALGVVIFAVVGAVVGESHLISGRLPTIVAVAGLLNGLLSIPTLKLLSWAMLATGPRRLLST